MSRFFNICDRVSSCSVPVIQKKKDACALRRSSPCHTHGYVRSLDLIVARRK